ncbi:asparaginase domain-containing protein [Geodermatophilus sp. URMC 61]|uniref:asparaginase domain-containing protein n=1 Tax=Geodermatophilus sp. URMC 61 TaxID=3423411 RepID=UPI00406BFB20
MLRVAVLGTGGTIAPRTDRSGTAVARATGQELLGDSPPPAGVAVDAEDVLRVDGCAMTLQRQQQQQQRQPLAVRVDERLRHEVTASVTRSAIGHGAGVDTATALWATLLSRSDVLVDLLLALPAHLTQPPAPSAPTPVVAAMADAAAATARSTLSSRLPEPGRER